MNASSEGKRSEADEIIISCALAETVGHNGRSRRT